MKNGWVALALSSLFLSGGLWASEAVQPLEGRHGGKAGDTADGSFLVTNIMAYDVDVIMSVADFPNPGEAVSLPKGNAITLQGGSPFRLQAGESRSVSYHVVFPQNFEKPAVGAVSLVVRVAGDTSSTPVVNVLLPIYLQPFNKDAILKIELLQPTVRFAATSIEAGAAKNIEVSVMVKNSGNAPLQPRGRVEVRKAGQTMETISLQGTTAISPNGNAIFSGLSQRTNWPNGAYEAAVTFDFGDYYGQPQKMEKTYFFRAEGDLISVQPGSAKPQKVTPR
ncbi:MAG: hypothetical protein IPP35_01285 [Elusimicrobia bacterium]|nr:hypothetical protein [Elusimicrobiota bacterium]